jgi:hypothetical protein
VDEAQPLEDRAARRQRVGVEPAVAALARELGALRDRRAVQAAAAELWERDAAEQAGELHAFLEVDTAARDRLPVDDGYDRSGLVREACAVPAAEDAIREVDELVCREANLDIVGRRRDRGGFGDDHRLLVLRLEPGGEEPLAQLGPVVGVVLPLDVAGNFAHPRDERLDVAVLRAPEHSAPALAHEQPVGCGQSPHLLVETREDLGRIHGRQAIVARCDGRPEEENLQVPPRQAASDACDQRAEGQRLPDVRPAEAPASRLPDLRHVQGPRGRAAPRQRAVVSPT